MNPEHDYRVALERLIRACELLREHLGNLPVPIIGAYFHARTILELHGAGDE